MGKLVQQLAVGSFGQPLERQGWAEEVAAEVLQLVAGVRSDGDIGMKARSPPGEQRRTPRSD
jgi:hypothetical protein